MQTQYALPGNAGLPASAARVEALQRANPNRAERIRERRLD